ncbi:hypothetical protein MZO42_00380 [Sphingomonas psychrotolerans]|uniref:Uncharacterized protein n=1 Tax=Sphingomonas psychrotolerans TaxID=1327635 RepID=A0ABU3N0U2_9SPHN|nr:hypothetical protein [Sphingomonas psychrotolerans]MDT8757141.1 hypothetical protein [Sphingomonas psychrotolerans]
MRRLIALVSLVAASSEASAQRLASPRNFVPARAQVWNGEQLECLVRKSDGKRECHTRTEWRRIARQLAENTRNSAE